MNSPLGFHRAGLVDIYGISLDHLRAKELPIKSLERPAEYWLFLPYVLLAVAPSCPGDPMEHSRLHVGVPNEMFCWKTDNPIVDLGQRGRELGISTNALFGIPAERAGEVENFLRSVVVLDPEHECVWALRLQRLVMLNPAEKLSRPIEQADDIMMDVYAFALDLIASSTLARAYLQPKPSGGLRVVLDTAGDPRLIPLYTAMCGDHDIANVEMTFYDQETIDGSRDSGGSESDTIAGSGDRDGSPVRRESGESAAGR